MTQKQKAKHTADKQPVIAVKVNVTSTPDGLGQWRGGFKKGALNWVSLKSKPTHTGDWKHIPTKRSSCMPYVETFEKEEPVGALNISLEKVEELSKELGPIHPDYVPEVDNESASTKPREIQNSTQESVE